MHEVDTESGTRLFKRNVFGRSTRSASRQKFPPRFSIHWLPPHGGYRKMCPSQVNARSLSESDSVKRLSGLAKLSSGVSKDRSFQKTHGKSHVVVITPGAFGHAIPMLQFVKRLSSRHRITFLLPGNFVDRLFKRGIVQATPDSPELEKLTGERSASNTNDEELEVEENCVDFIPSRLRIVRLNGLPPFPEDTSAGVNPLIDAVRALSPALEQCFQAAAERFAWGTEASTGGDDCKMESAVVDDWWPLAPTALAADVFCFDAISKVVKAMPALKAVPLFVFQPTSATVLRNSLKIESENLFGIDSNDEFPETTPDEDPKSVFKCEFIEGTNLLKLNTTQKPFALLLTKIFGSIRRSSGCLVDTFYELEQEEIDTHNKANPSFPMYPVGLLCAWTMTGEETQKGNVDSPEFQTIMSWLNAQSPKSVVYIAFGSLWTLEEAQIRELETAMFTSGKPFLWSLRAKTQQALLSAETRSKRKSADASMIEVSGEERKSAALFVDWCPQTAVLMHPGIGGFLTHCGWNSTTETIYAGVPAIAWPLGAEQHDNAKFLVERNLAVQIPQTMQYGRNVGMDEIQAAIRELFEGRVKDTGTSRSRYEISQEVAEKARRAVCPGRNSRRNMVAFPFFDKN